MKYAMISLLALICAVPGFSNFLVIYPNQLAYIGVEEEINGRSAEINVLSGILTDTFATIPAYESAFYMGAEMYVVDRLLKDWEGHEITWLFADGTKGAYTLVCAEPVLLKGPDGIFKPLNGTPVFASLPRINTEPKMSVRFDENVPRAKVSYQLQGLGWEAFYALHLEEDAATLRGTLKIANALRETIHTDNLILFSGQINRVSQNDYAVPAAPRAQFYLAEEKEASFGGGASDFSGYVLYPVPGVFDFSGEQSTYYRFLEFRQPYEKRYTFSSTYYTNESAFRALNQTIHMEELTKAVPAGTVSVYQKRAFDTVLIGESALSDKPIGDTVDIAIGRTVELQGKFELIESREEGKESIRRYRLTVKNYTEKPLKAYTYTSVPDDSVLWLSDKRIERTKANQLFTLVEVAPKAEEVVIFGIRYAR